MLNYNYTVAVSKPFHSISFLLLCMAMFFNSIASHVVLFFGVNLPILLLAVSLLFLVVDIAISRKMHVLSYDTVPPFLLSAWAVLSIYWSQNTENTVSFSYYYVVSAIVYMLVRYHANLWNRWVLIGLWFIIGGIIASIILLINWRLGLTVDGVRITIGGMNSNYIGYSIATAAAIAVALFYYSSFSVFNFFLFASTIIIFGFGIMLTGCRSAFLAYILLLITFFINTIRKKTFYSLFFLTLSITALITILSSVPADLQYRMFSSSILINDLTVGDNLSGRLFVWPIAYELFMDNLLFGVGAGAFQSLNPLGIGVHNVFLSVAVELGLVGVLLYIFPLFYISIPMALTPVRRAAVIFIMLVWGIIAMAGIWEVSIAAWFAFAWMASTPKSLRLNRNIIEG